MAKKENNSIIAGILIGFFIIIVILRINPNQAQSDNYFVEKEKEGTSLGSNLGTGTTTITRTNLCDTIKPYVILFDLQNLCNSNGGTWVCNRNDIGCYNLANELLNCELEVVQTALSQCRGKSATSYCSASTLYCKY